MRKGKQPVLTIGIIFKNEARCLERCLKSLTPLRKAIPCELILEDTGSSDGSREIALRYADELFDFPWSDDFSAARNAVMDRASGKWYLTVDADEYLDADISELAAFLGGEERGNAACALVQRNYDSQEMDGDYFDFMAIRMLRMSLGLRYQGAIHEFWDFPEDTQCWVIPLERTILHHDGYAGLSGEQGKEKRERNLALIKEKLKQNPEDLVGLTQYIESGSQAQDFLEVMRRGAALIREKRDGWETFGAPFLRYAVQNAQEKELPEYDEWVRQAWEQFPDSYFTRIDVEYIAFARSWSRKEYDACLEHGEQYLAAVKDYRKNSNSSAELLRGSLLCASPYCEQKMLLYLADVWLQKEQPEQSADILSRVEPAYFDTGQIENFIRVLWKTHVANAAGTSAVLKRFAESLKGAGEDRKMDILCRAAANMFTQQGRQEEKTWKGFRQPSYTLFLSLGENHDLGRAAMVLQSEKEQEMEALLSGVKRWDRFPAGALAHALLNGADFPPAGNGLRLEEARDLAVRLSKERENFFEILSLQGRADQKTVQKLVWTKELVLIAVQIYDWASKTEPGQESEKEKGIVFARLFADIERTFLSRYYMPEFLEGENLLALPAIHRFGWHCKEAFRSLDEGELEGYVHSLKEGLCICPEMSAMVEYLLKHTPQLKEKQSPEKPPELLALAAQVRTLLSAYPQGHPAVEAIKKSEAYRKVAQLIEND